MPLASTKARRDYLDDCRESYEIWETDREILKAHEDNLSKLTQAQKMELDLEELVCNVTPNGWALTLGGVYIEPDGSRNFG